MGQTDKHSDFYEFPSRKEKPEKPAQPKEPNSMARVSMLLGLAGIMLSCSCSLFPGAIALGVAAVATAVLSKKGKPIRAAAVLGIIMGILAIIAGVLEFMYLVMLTTAMKNPEYAPFFNQVFDQLEQAGYFEMLPETLQP